MTKLQNIIKYLFRRFVEPYNYAEITEGMKRLHPELLHWTLDKHNMWDDMATKTKLEYIIRYLGARVEAVHYAEITEDMKRLHPEIFHCTFDKHKLNALLSDEMMKHRKPRVAQVKKGYYAVLEE